MELNWSTFLLEIINFLILVWILKRFFYRPVLNVIARRKAGIDKTLDDARALHEDAATLRDRYKNRLAEWQQERRAHHAELDREIDAERARRMTELQAALADEREKARVIEARRLDAERLQNEELALAQGARFSARLLAAAAGPETEQRLHALLLEELAALPPERLQALRSAAGVTDERIRVCSAHPLDEAARHSLEETLTTTLGADLPFDYEQDPALIAGLRVTIGAWVLRANLQDELLGFAELRHEA